MKIEVAQKLLFGVKKAYLGQMVKYLLRNELVYVVNVLSGYWQ